MAGDSGFSAVDVRLTPCLDSVVETGFEKTIEADDGVTHSLKFPNDTLIGCKVHEYRHRIVDASVMGIFPREVAQEVMVPTNSLMEFCREM